MVLIVAHHYVVNSGLTAEAGPIFGDPLSWRSLFLLLLGAWGKIGINCFVIITGYFMCCSHISARKFAKLLFEIYFYRIVISLVFFLTGYETLTLSTLVKLCVPITDVSNGFTQAYLVFFLFIPFLNILIRNMNERQHLFLLLWCGLTYVFLGTIPFFTVTMNYVSWFCVLYSIASYIRLYPKKCFCDAKLWRLLTAAVVTIDILSVLGCVWIGTKIGRNLAYTFVTDSNTFLAVATGVSAFLLFKNLKIKHSFLINAISASTFGVLIIHTFNNSMRNWLWNDVFDVIGHYGDNWMPLYAIGCISTIFIVCTVIDQLRLYCVEKPLFKLWDANWDTVIKKYQMVEDSILSKIGINR